MKRVLLILLFAYISIAGLLSLGQERLLFLPEMGGRELVASPSDRGLAYDTVWLETEDGERLHAWWIPHPQARGVVHFSHGNAGNISHRLDSVQIFHDLGLSVLIYDYRGYGRSTGRPGEAEVQEDARAAWRWLTQEADVAPEDIVLFGRSLGGAVAALLAAEVESGGLILESTFTSVPDLAAELYWWLPARWLARIQLDARAALGNVDRPTLIIHSRSDDIVPFAHARQLLETAGDQARLVEIEGTHNTGFLISRDAYQEGLNAFLIDLFSFTGEAADVNIERLH